MTSAEVQQSHVEHIAPAGTGRETRWLLWTAALVLTLSALIVAWQRHGTAPVHLAAHQIDLATGLTPVEQGIVTDLQAVHDEWLHEGAPLPPPAPEHWAQEGWPPFTDDLTAQRRGSVRWQAIVLAERHAYLARLAVGSAAAANPPRDLLWRLHAGEHAEDFDVWLLTVPSANARAGLPSQLDDASLASAGWQQVATRDADLQSGHPHGHNSTHSPAPHAR